MSIPTIPEPYAHLIEHLQDAVITFELAHGDPIVREVNSAFEEVFGYAEEDIVGESLNDWIVPDWLAGEARGLDRRTKAGEINYKRVTRETADGLRDFLYRGIPTEVDGDRTGGFAVYTDLTDISRSERRLQVMNRVMRHNVRNKATVILAHTSRLLDALEDAGPHVQAMAEVEHAAAELERLAREAAEVESILNAPRSPDAEFDIVADIHATINEFRDRFPDASIDTDLPPELEIAGDGHFRVAIEALIENAIIHNPDSNPTVRVAAKPVSPGWVLFSVDDDAPRIPKADRAVVEGSTEITPTRHGTGLGLSMVAWCAERIGGDIAFERSDLGGNSVRLRLPASHNNES